MNPWRNTWAITKRELGAYFSSPVAYVFIVIFLLLTGFFTFMWGRFFERGQANLDAFFTWHPWLYAVFVPCVGMRLWAEERRVGTIELLLTKPITAWQAILGKFAASWIFLGLSLALTFPVLITVNYLGSPDNGAIAAAYLGSFLMAGSYLAISCMTSAMTRNQVVSFILSVIICLFLVLCGYPPVTDLLARLDKPWLVDLVASLSVMTHFQSLSTGLVDSRDVIFFLLIVAFALFTNGVILRSHQAALDPLRTGKSLGRLLFSTGGVAAMFVLMVAAYIVAGALRVRLDVTADKAHTLSEGTKRILAKLDSRVTARFYCTQSEGAMPPPLKTYSQHVEDLLREYQQQANGHLVVQKFDPKPDSDIEEAAGMNGMEGRLAGPFGTDKIYLGVVVSLLDEKVALPWLAPERERLLEYDLSRAIARVVSRSRSTIGLMSALPVFGEAPDPLMRPGENRAQEWAFVSELKKDFTVREVPMTADRIDDQIKVLLIVHPQGISDRAQYAIDQFVLRGGKLVAFLDPHAYFDQQHGPGQNFSMMGDNASNSSLDRLLKAWGLDMDITKVVADTTFAGRNTQTGDAMPTLLLITHDGINSDAVVTSQIDNLFLPFAGAFTGRPAPGLSGTVLVKCSRNSELVDGLIASAASERLYRTFKAANVEYPLALHLAGEFKTAFPNGPPPDNSRPSQASTNIAAAPSGNPLTSGHSQVVLVSDTDMLNDKVCVRIQNVMGHRVIRPMNGNLNFLQNLIEQFAGDDDLISSRSRASMNRPFTRVQALEAQAGKQWQQKVMALEDHQRETEQRIKDLQTQHTDAGGASSEPILSPRQQQELEKYHRERDKVRRDLREVRKRLRHETDALEYRTKIINIGTMPLVVACSGLGLAIVKTRRRSAR